MHRTVDPADRNRFTIRPVSDSGSGTVPPSTRLFLAMLPAAGGLGLVVYVVAGVSLPLAAGVLAIGGLLTWIAVLDRLGSAARRDLRDRVRLGLGAGVVATLAYDAARYGLVSVLSFSFRPFHVFPIFGRLFLGTDAPDGPALAVGIAYHISNGVGFALAYALLVRRASTRTGIAWALLLELCMALLYPSWLRIAQLEEFLAVSMLGHVVYGAVLGTAVARGAARRDGHGERAPR